MHATVLLLSLLSCVTTSMGVMLALVLMQISKPLLLRNGCRTTKPAELRHARTGAAAPGSGRKPAADPLTAIKARIAETPSNGGVPG